MDSDQLDTEYAAVWNREGFLLPQDIQHDEARCLEAILQAQNQISASSFAAKFMHEIRFMRRN